MPVLTNPRHERFAQELAKGSAASQAYKIAGYDTDGNAAESAASRLLRNVQVKARVAELQGHNAERCKITTESLTTEAADIQTAALRDGQYSAAVAALTAKAKLAGKWIDRAEHGQPGEFDAMADEDLQAQLRQEAAAIGLPLDGETQH